MSGSGSRSGSRAALEGAAAVVWHGDLRSGQGSLRFELGAGGELPLLWPGSDAYGPGATSPEELAAAAHAACFTMTLAHGLARGGHPPHEIATDVRTTFAVAAGERRIQSSRLELFVESPGLEEAELQQATEVASRFCPVSNTLRAAGVEIEMRVQLAPA